MDLGRSNLLLKEGSAMSDKTWGLCPMDSWKLPRAAQDNLTILFSWLKKFLLICRTCSYNLCSLLLALLQKLWIHFLSDLLCKYWKTLIRSPQRFFCCQGTVLAHVQPPAYKNPPDLFSRAALQPFRSLPISLQGVLPVQARTLLVLLVEFCTVPFSQGKLRSTVSPSLSGAGHLVTRHTENAEILNEFFSLSFHG